MRTRHKLPAKGGYGMGKAPALAAYLELNKRFGYGYQARIVIDGVIDSTLDSEPFTLEEAYSGCVMAIDEINKETGYGYDPRKLIAVTGEGVQANRKRDFASARAAKDIEKGRGEMAVPEKQHFIPRSVNGKEDVLCSACGVIMMAFFGWRDEQIPKCREALQRYCEYLAVHGCGGRASEIWGELEAMGMERGMDWIKATHGRYVANDMDLIQSVMGGL